MDKVLHSSESVEWGTPPDLYAKLNKRYCFDYDPASTHENHLTYRYSTLEGTFDDHNGHLLKLGDEDGLEWEWDDNHIFLNPPYGRGIGAWMKKAAEADALVVALLPVRTGSGWWKEWVEPYADIEFLRGRLTFVGARWPAPFDSAIARYR